MPNKKPRKKKRSKQRSKIKKLNQALDDILLGRQTRTPRNREGYSIGHGANKRAIK